MFMYCLNTECIFCIYTGGYWHSGKSEKLKMARQAEKVADPCTKITLLLFATYIIKQYFMLQVDVTH